MSVCECASVCICGLFVCMWECICVFMCVSPWVHVRVCVCLYFTNNYRSRFLRTIKGFSVPKVLTGQLERGSKHSRNHRESQMSKRRALEGEGQCTSRK